jgi:hypothetical protein
VTVATGTVVVPAKSFCFGSGGFGVEITGWDSVVFTFTPPREVFARILAAVVARWPVALVTDLDAPDAAPGPAVGFVANRPPNGAGHLLFYRDMAMAEHMDQAAYAPMADGDGPFAVLTRERRNAVFAVAGLAERWAADHTPGGPHPPDPYEAWLCSPLVVEVTAVTPADPASHVFSSWVLAEVKRACSGVAEPLSRPTDVSTTDAPRRG